VEICCSEEDALRKHGVTASAPSPVEKRKNIRIDTHYSGEISFGSQKFRGVMRNVSEGGALLGYVDSIELPVPSGKSTENRVFFNFRLRFMGDMEVSGEFIRFHPPDSEMRYMGIRFLHNENSRHLIRRICEDPPPSSFPAG
jgi:hypothetical protein